MKLFIISLLFINPIIVYAYEADRAISNLASDYATCSAYYSLMAYGSENNKDARSNFNKVAQYAFFAASKLSNKRVTESRIELDIKAMMKEIDYSFSNGAILINKYGEYCKGIIDNPKARLQYWLDKKPKTG